MSKEELETRIKLKLLNVVKEWLRTEHWEGSIESLIKLILSFTEPRDKRIEELEKENTELREELNYAKTHCLFHSDCPIQKENAKLKKENL